MRAVAFGLALLAMPAFAAAAPTPAPAAQAFERLCIDTRADPIAAGAAAKAAGWKTANLLEQAVLDFMGNVHGHIVVVRPKVFRAVLLLATGSEADKGCGVVANGALAPTRAALIALLGQPAILPNERGLRWEAGWADGALRPVGRLTAVQQAELAAGHRKVAIVLSRDDTTGILFLIYIKDQGLSRRVRRDQSRSKALILAFTSSRTSGGAEPLRTALRARQSRLLSWSARAALGGSWATTTSKT